MDFENANLTDGPFLSCLQAEIYVYSGVHATISEFSLSVKAKQYFQKSH